MTNDYGTEAVAVHHDSHSKTYQATKQRRSAPCRAACAGSDVCGTTKRTAKGRRAAPRKSIVRIPERHCFIHVTGNTHNTYKAQKRRQYKTPKQGPEGRHMQAES